MDASGLLVVIFGMLPPDDPRASKLVTAHLAALSEGPRLRRYRRDNDDGFHGTDATFTPCSWWAVTALCAVGRDDEARARADALSRGLPRLVAEGFDPAQGLSLGNTPLVWAHAEIAPGRAGSARRRDSPPVRARRGCSRTRRARPAPLGSAQRRRFAFVATDNRRRAGAVTAPS